MKLSNYVAVVLECNGSSLCMGREEDGERYEFGITKLTGLESSELEISSSENAFLDGVTVEGKRIKSRPIHIEASIRDGVNSSAIRQRIIKFFNPKYSGKATIGYSGVSRNIKYELEGWSFVVNNDVNQRLAIVVDLMCEDPYFLKTDNFGKNMADKTPLFAFPWRVARKKVYDIQEPYKGMALGGMTMGYRTLKKEVALYNDGDVTTGVILECIATRGYVVNPIVTHLASGQFMRVVLTMEEGDVLTIETNKINQRIELNGVNCYQWIDRLSEPFQLDVGHNYIAYDADENYVNLDINVYYTPKYLGV